MERCPIYPSPLSMSLDDPVTGVRPARSLICCEEDAVLVRRFFEAAGVKAEVRPHAGVCRYEVRSAEASAPPAEGVPTHGYAMRLGPEGVALIATDESGFYAGLQSLWQMLDIETDMGAALIVDAPVVGVRSFQVDLGRQPETLAELKRLLRQQARYHYNECQLYVENSLKLAAFGPAADPNGLTCGELAELQDYGAALGVDVVLSLNLLGHMEKILNHPLFGHLSETRHGARHPAQDWIGTVCPELPESRRFVAAVIEEACGLTRSAKLMVGLDECWTLGSHPLSRKRLDSRGGAGEIFRDWIRFLYREVSRHGKQMWMWEDMLFYHEGALGAIPSDIGMNAWHYQHIEEYPHYSFRNWERVHAIEELTRHGHPVMLCCGPEPHHVQSMIRYAEGYPLTGILIVQWSGGWTVQEWYHIDRALAAGVLWSGRYPDGAAAARAVLGCGPDEAPAAGDVFWRLQAPDRHKSGGSARCPRFWSWPENALELIEKNALAGAIGRLKTAGEALEIKRDMLLADLADLETDVARETAALVGRAMLQKGLRRSGVLDEAIRMLEGAAARAESVAGRGRVWQARYCAPLPDRAMVRRFATAPDEPRALLERLRRFQHDPSPETWPFAPVSLHVDLFVLDPCAHQLKLLAGDSEDALVVLYDGGVKLGLTLEGMAVVSVPVEAEPRLVRLEVGGFASLGVLRVRLETLRGTRLATRVVDKGGYVRDAEHLLLFDRKMAVMNPPDVVSNWLDLQAPRTNFVTLEF